MRATVSRLALSVVVLSANVGAAGSQEAPADSARLQRTPAWLLVWANSARASASEGPVWLGRGVTLAGSAGAEGRWGRFSWSFRPVAFVSQNAAYDPSRSRTRADGDFRDPWYPGTVDRPYRLGDGVALRVDPGESFARYDTRWLSTGLSSAAQRWGPAYLQPLMMAGRGGGFPHAFLATGAPLNIGLGHLSARWIVGRLSASGYGPVHAGTSHRLAAGAVGSWTPPWLDALQLGAARFFHLYDTAPVRDLTTVLLPISELLKDRTGGVEDGPRQYNQLASVFVRVAPARGPLQIYGEFLRDDHSANMRDALVELDHNSAYMVGVRRVAERSAERRTLTIEFSNGRFTHLDRVRPQASMYEHTRIVEGHSHRGLLLGAPGLMGGGGWTVEWRRDELARRRAWTVSAAVVRIAQDTVEEGFGQEPAGYYSLEVSRELERRGYAWRPSIRMEPGFGDLRGVNVGVGLRVARWGR